MKYVYIVPNLAPRDYLPGVQPSYSFLTYLQGNVRWGCSLFIRFLNPPPGNCLPGVKYFYTVSKTYLRGAVFQGYSQVIPFLNLPAGDCQSELQPVFTVSETTSRVLLSRSVAHLYGFGTYLKEPVNLWCSMFIKFLNLPTRAFQPEVQPIDMVFKPTFRGLLAGGIG